MCKHLNEEAALVGEQVRALIQLPDVLPQRVAQLAARRLVLLRGPRAPQDGQNGESDQRESRETYPDYHGNPPRSRAGHGLSMRMLPLVPEPRERRGQNRPCRVGSGGLGVGVWYIYDAFPRI